MKFEELRKMLLEFEVGYKIPKDKEKLLYDFYTLELIYNLEDNPEGRPTFSFRDDPELKFALEDTKDTILNHLKEEMLVALFFAISSEFRHIFHNTNQGSESLSLIYDDLKIKPKPTTYYKKAASEKIQLYKFFEKRKKLDFFKNYAKNLFEKTYPGKRLKVPKYSSKVERELLKNIDKERKASFVSIKMTKIPQKEFVELAKEVFRLLRWEPGYGGKSWSRVCEGWLKLSEAKTDPEKFIWMDHVYDIQHNSDTVFDKLNVYYKVDTEWDWLKVALDFKANIKDPWEIWEVSSRPMKKLGARILFQKGWGTVEEFLKGKSKKVEEMGVVPAEFEWRNSDVAREWVREMNKKGYKVFSDEYYEKKITLYAVKGGKKNLKKYFKEVEKKPYEVERYLEVKPKDF